MTRVIFNSGGNEREGYLALPESGTGKGLLFLHAWWGLNDFFKGACDRFASEGFVTFAPDLHHGKVASSVEEATHILETRDFPATQETAEAALHYLQTHPAVQGARLSAIGFSMGAAFALMLDSIHPDAFDKIVLFYGPSDADFSKSKAEYQAHFAENDDWEPVENVRKMQAPNAEIYIYPDAGHWFFESDREDADKPEAAQLAWERTLGFLRE